ncbi:MAG: hypothetical protein HY744_04460 [Deltaproteobacteria bacterium]|nr:hypothetical protein [Deltaproteobacteria bacterium]
MLPPSQRPFRRLVTLLVVLGAAGVCLPARGQPAVPGTPPAVEAPVDPPPPPAQTPAPENEVGEVPAPPPSSPPVATPRAHVPMEPRAFWRPAIEDKPRSPGMKYTGMALTAHAAVLTGLAIWSFAEADGTCSGGCHDVQGLGAIPWMIGGAVTGGLAVISLAVGIPLWVVGASPRSEDDEVENAGNRSGRAAPSAGLGPELRVGPLGAEARWRF